MNNLGTYSVVITDDGNGVSFSAKPSPLALVSLVIFIIFPPYTLFLFLTLHFFLGNPNLPMVAKVLKSVKIGGEITINAVKDLIAVIANGEQSENEEEHPYDVPEMHDMDDMDDMDDRDDMDEIDSMVAENDDDLEIEKKLTKWDYESSEESSEEEKDGKNELKNPIQEITITSYSDILENEHPITTYDRDEVFQQIIE